MKRWPIIVAVVMLMSAWGSLQVLSHGEPVLVKKPFAEFPLTIGERWQGKGLGLGQTVLDVLRLSDYMMRVYVPLARGERLEAMGKSEHSGGRGEAINGSRLTNNGATSPVWLYVGFYQSQRTGSTYHSPKNCLPGAGWQFVESDQVTVPIQKARGEGRQARGESREALGVRREEKDYITINKVLIQKGLDQQVILYWYHDRGRVIASEYAAKGYLMWDAMTKNRTDGALVRISVPVTSTTEEAYQQGAAFLRDVWPLLSDFMPAGNQV